MTRNSTSSNRYIQRTAIVWILLIALINIDLFGAKAAAGQKLTEFIRGVDLALDAKNGKPYSKPIVVTIDGADIADRASGSWPFSYKEYSELVSLAWCSGVAGIFVDISFSQSTQNSGTARQLEGFAATLRRINQGTPVPAQYSEYDPLALCSQMNRQDDPPNIPILISPPSEAVAKSTLARWAVNVGVPSEGMYYSVLAAETEAVHRRPAALTLLDQVCGRGLENENLIAHQEICQSFRKKRDGLGLTISIRDNYGIPRAVEKYDDISGCWKFKGGTDFPIYLAEKLFEGTFGTGDQPKKWLCPPTPVFSWRQFMALASGEEGKGFRETLNENLLMVGQVGDGLDATAFGERGQLSRVMQHALAVATLTDPNNQNFEPVQMPPRAMMTALVALLIASSKFVWMQLQERKVHRLFPRRVRRSKLIPGFSMMLFLGLLLLAEYLIIHMTYEWGRWPHSDELADIFGLFGLSIARLGLSVDAFWHLIRSQDSHERVIK